MRWEDNWQTLRFSDGEVRFVAREDIPSPPPATYFIATSTAEDWEVEKADLVLNGTTDKADLDTWFADHPRSTHYISSGDIILLETPTWTNQRLIGVPAHYSGTGVGSSLRFEGLASNFVAGFGGGGSTIPLFFLLGTDGMLELHNMGIVNALTSIGANSICFLRIISLGVERCVFDKLSMQTNSAKDIDYFAGGSTIRSMNYSTLTHIINDSGGTMDMSTPAWAGYSECYFGQLEQARTNQANIANSYLLFANPTSTIAINNNLVVPGSSSVGPLLSTHIFVGNGSDVATDVAASGDVTLLNTGAFTVTRIQNRAVQSVLPTNGQFLIWEDADARWEPKSLSGDVTNDAAGVVTIKTSVALAGNPTTTTQSAGNNSTRIATTAYVDAAVAAVSGIDGNLLAMGYYD